jgi:predicted acetyltransferase
VDVSLRWCTDDDWERLAQADGWGFGFHYDPQELADRKPLHQMDRFLVAEVDNRIVGVTGDYPMEMTVPGGASIPVPGVTWVSVIPGFRRRGILRRLMVEQHRRFVDEGLALAILTASEGSIYGRFGYGTASWIRRVELRRGAARLRSDAPRGTGARLVTVDEAMALVPGLHERWRRRTPGGITRSPAWWDYWRQDHERDRGGRTARFYLLHENGYATYRAEHHWGDGHPDHLVGIEDLFASTPEAYADLWAFLLDLDLYARLSSFRVPPGDPLPFLLTDPRQVRTLVSNDGLWVRFLDVPAALSARRYPVDGAVVLEVVDEVWGRGGTFRLEVSGGVGRCVATGGLPDLTLGIAALGAAYLGGTRLATLAEAGLVSARAPGALGLADAMFASERAPQYGTSF